MNFKEISRTTKVLKQGWLAFSIVEFEILKKQNSELQTINNFIHGTEDFDLADKYNNGIVWHHTDELGERNIRVFNYGPYLLESLTIKDYDPIDFNNLISTIDNFFFDEEPNFRQQKDFLKFMNHIISKIKKLKSTFSFYLLNPKEVQEAFITAFQPADYLSCFCINLEKRKFIVLQLDDK